MKPFIIYSVRRWKGVKNTHYYIQTDAGCMIYDGMTWKSLLNTGRIFKRSELKQLDNVLSKFTN